MRALIGNEVKTDYANHVFATREEAEAFYVSLKDRDTGAREAPSSQANQQQAQARQQQARHPKASRQQGSGVTPTRSQR